MTSADAGIEHVAWSRSASIYEVNLRQYTPEGTFAAFERELPRLQAMGVDIVWLMPIHPIGLKERKGSVGSHYSIRDHVAVNPDFGSLADFERLVGAIHARGMHVIIDWVANHTAWDHPWVSAHPDWYLKNDRGEIGPYAYDNGREIEHWTDVVGLDYAQPALWQAMTDAMLYWVRETGIDGYRCDVAEIVPTPFWEQARAALDRVKPVFMLAEGSAPELHRSAFDMTYDWALYDAMTQIAHGRGDAGTLVAWLDGAGRRYPPDAYRMTFTTNHDKNSWEGHDAETFGRSFKAFAVLAATLPGMPLVYGGQESCLDRRLAFFEKDPIDWKHYPLGGFYTELLQLKRGNPALWNGRGGGGLELLPWSTNSVLAFTRRHDARAVTVIANLSAEPREVRGSRNGDDTLRLEPWAYRIQAR